MLHSRLSLFDMHFWWFLSQLCREASVMLCNIELAKKKAAFWKTSFEIKFEIKSNG